MKHLLITTIAAVLLVGWGKPQPPDISIHDADLKGNTEAVKQHLDAGADVNSKERRYGYARSNGYTPLHSAAEEGHRGIAELLATFPSLGK